MHCIMTKQKDEKIKSKDETHQHSTVLSVWELVEDYQKPEQGKCLVEKLVDLICENIWKRGDQEWKCILSITDICLGNKNME